jgi:hypothetical protein
VNQPLPDLSDPQEKVKVLVEVAALEQERDQSKFLFGNKISVAARLQLLKATLYPPPPEPEAVPDAAPEPETPLEPSVEVAPPVPFTACEKFGRWLSKTVLTLLLK